MFFSDEKCKRFSSEPVGFLYIFLWLLVQNIILYAQTATMGNRQTFQTIRDIPPIAQKHLHVNHPSRTVCNSVDKQTHNTANDDETDEDNSQKWRWTFVTRKPTNEAHKNGIYVMSSCISDGVRTWLRDIPVRRELYCSEGVNVICSLYGGTKCSTAPVLMVGVDSGPYSISMISNTWVVLNPLSAQPQAPVFLHDRHMNVLLKFLTDLKREFNETYRSTEEYVSKKDLLSATQEQTVYV